MARPVYIRDESANSGALGEAPFVTPFVLAFVDIVLAGFLVTLESVDRKKLRGENRIQLVRPFNPKARVGAAAVVDDSE